jgi:uncharacterized membrane protein YoaK (UPF0700 family)
MANAAGQRRSWLAAIGGCADRIGWLRLQELFGGFMSRTRTPFSVAIAEWQPGKAAELAGLSALGARAGRHGAWVVQAAAWWRRMRLRCRPWPPQLAAVVAVRRV